MSIEEWQRQNKDDVGLVVDDTGIILFAVGDLRDNCAPIQPGEDDAASPEPNCEDVYKKAPADEKVF